MADDFSEDDLLRNPDRIDASQFRDPNIVKQDKLLQIESKLPERLTRDEMKYLLENKSKVILFEEPIKKSKPENWTNYHKIVYKNSSGELVKMDYAICKLCQQNNKLAFYSCRSSKDGLKNIIEHSKSKHSNVSTASSHSSSLPNVLQKFVERKLPEQEKEKITNAATVGLAIANRPYHMLQDPGILLWIKAISNASTRGPIDLLSAVCHQSTPPKKLKTIVPQGFEELKQILSDVPGVSITSDHWKDVVQRTFLSFTVSYSDMQNECIITRFIALEKVLKKTHKETKVKTAEILNKFEVIKKETFTTTDNAIATAFDPSKHASCIRHNIALFLHDAFYSDTKKTKRTLQSSEPKLWEAFTKSKFETKVTSKFKNMYGNQLDVYGEEAKDELRIILRQIIICKSLVRHIKHAGIELKGKTLKQEVNVRWDTLHDMIESINQGQTEIRTFNGKPKEMIDMIDFTVLSQFQNFLLQFRTIGLKLSYQTKPTMTYVVPLSLNLYNLIENCPLFKHCHPFLMTLFKKHVIDRWTNVHFCSAIFSPLGFTSWKSEMQKHYRFDEDYEFKVQKVLLEFDARNKPSSIVDESNSQSKDNISIQKNRPFSSQLLPFGATKSDLINPTSTPFKVTEKSIWDEFIEYQDRLPQIFAKYYDQEKGTETHSLFYVWKDLKPTFPKLYKASTFYLCIQATSIASERIFKRSKIMISPLSNRISVTTVSNKMFVNQNPDLFAFRVLDQIGEKSNMSFYKYIAEEVSKKASQEMKQLKLLEDRHEKREIPEIVEDEPTGVDFSSDDFEDTSLPDETVGEGEETATNEGDDEEMENDDQDGDEILDEEDDMDMDD